MNTSIVTQTSKSWAFQVGQQDAQSNAPFAPEAWFASPTQKRDYALGYESIKGVTIITAQISGSEMPAPVAPILVTNLKVNDRERVRRIDNSTYERMVSLTEKRQKRVNQLLAATLEFCPNFLDGDVLATA